MPALRSFHQPEIFYYFVFWRDQSLKNTATLMKIPAEYPHTFTSKLKGQNVVEHDREDIQLSSDLDFFLNWKLIYWFFVSKVIENEQKFFSLVGASLRLAWRRTMQKFPGTGGHHFLIMTQQSLLLGVGEWCARGIILLEWPFVFSNFGNPQRWQEDQLGGWKSWDCRWWKDEETDFQGCWWLIGAQQDFPCSGHPPWGCWRDYLQDKQRFLLLPAESCM